MTDALELPPRVIFYLENHEMIEEWHRLGYEAARTATSDVLKTLLGDVEEVASGSGLEAMSVEAGKAGKYALLYLKQPGAPLVANLVPMLGICFAWNPSWVLLDSDTYAPFVAVRVARGQDDGWKVAREQFLSSARKRRDELGLRHEPEWPIWKRVKADAGWWEDFERYRTVVRDALAQFVDEFQPAIDAAAAAE